jgi:hypothetical protein
VLGINNKIILFHVCSRILSQSDHVLSHHSEIYAFLKITKTILIILIIPRFIVLAIDLQLTLIHYNRTSNMTPQMETLHNVIP